MALTLARGHTARERRAGAPFRLLGARGCALVHGGRDTACWPDLPPPSVMTSPDPGTPSRGHTPAVRAPKPGELVSGHPGESLTQAREFEACLSAEKYGPQNFAKCQAPYPPDIQQKGADVRSLHREADRDPPPQPRRGVPPGAQSGPCAPFLHTGGQRRVTWFCSTLPLLS